MVTDPRSPLRAALWALNGAGEDTGRIKMARTWLNMHWADRPQDPKDLEVFHEVRNLMDARLKGENDVSAADFHAMLSQILSPELLAQENPADCP